MEGRTHLFCPMGDDWYTANIQMDIENPVTIPDYIDVTRKLEEMDGGHLIIEDAALEVAQFIHGQTGTTCKVSIQVDDARHIPVIVEVEA